MDEFEGYDFTSLKELFDTNISGCTLIDIPGYGRCLEATRTFQPGDILFSETSIAPGTTYGKYARQCLVEELASLESNGAPDEDAIHPDSTLCDCICNILLQHKRWKDNNSNAEDTSPIFKKIATLCRKEESNDSDMGTATLHDFLKPEFQEMCTKETLSLILRALIANRFHSTDGLDCFFYASMFEHNCKSNVFCSDLNCYGRERKFRALQHINIGDRLSIDYLNFPNNYTSTAIRRDGLTTWGFKCICSRCENIEERCRVFVCPNCKEEELYAGSWRCGFCHAVADEEYIQQCIDQEEQVTKLPDLDLWESYAPLGRYHYIFLQYASTWSMEAEMMGGELDARVPEYIMETLLWYYTPMTNRLPPSENETEHRVNQPGDENDRTTMDADRWASQCTPSSSSKPLSFREHYCLHPTMTITAHTLSEIFEKHMDKQNFYALIERKCLEEFNPEIAEENDRQMWRMLGFGDQKPPEQDEEWRKWAEAPKFSNDGCDGEFSERGPPSPARTAIHSTKPLPEHLPFMLGGGSAADHANLMEKAIEARDRKLQGIKNNMNCNNRSDINLAELD